LDVIAELGIHERFFAICMAILHAFCPQELLIDLVTELFLVDVISVVRHTLVRREFVLF
jgi:hypothetical protein